MTTPVTLPTGQTLSFGPYPNPRFHRGQPHGQTGTAKAGGRRLPAVRALDGRVWCPAGERGDWFSLSAASAGTFAPASPSER